MKVCSKVMDTVKKYLIGSDIEILVRVSSHSQSKYTCVYIGK